MLEPRQTANGPETGDGPATEQGWTTRLVLSTIFMAMVLEALGLGATMISTGLPAILKDFPTTQGGWLTTAYFLAGAVSCPLLGKAADLFGKRRVLLATVLLSGVGAVTCALAPSFAVLIVGRALQGPILATLSLIPSLIRDVYPPRQAVLASSVVITGFGLFSVFTPLLVGWLIDHAGWRGLFWFDTAWTLGLGAAIRLVTPETPLRQKARIDFVGASLLSLGILGVLLYVSMGRGWGWTSVRGMLLLAAGIVLLALLFLHARRAAEPIVNFALFRRKPLLFVATGGAIGYGIAITVSQVLPMFGLTPRAAGHTYGLGLSTFEFASIGTPQALATVGAGLVLSFLVTRGWHPQRFLIIGLAAWPVGCVLLAYFNDTLGQLVLGALVTGVGNGLVNASVPNMVMRATPAGDQGSTAGTVQLCQTGFSAVTPVLMFAVLAPHATVFSGGGVVYGEQGFRNWLLIAAALAVAMIGIGAALLRERRGEAIQEFIAVPVAEAPKV
jgi:MFS family permease